MLIASYRQGMSLWSNPPPPILPSSLSLSLVGLCIIMAARTVAFRLLSFCSGGACVASRMAGSWQREILLLPLLLLLLLLLLLPLLLLLLACVDPRQFRNVRMQIRKTRPGHMSGFLFC